MGIFTLLLIGPINKPLEFQVLRLYNVNEGEWEIAIASASIIYDVKIPRTLASISCNYVRGQSINEKNEVVATRQILGITTIGRAAGEKHTISFKRDYFIINRPDPILSVYIENLEGSEQFSGATVYLYMYLRRRR